MELLRNFSSNIAFSQRLRIIIILYIVIEIVWMNLLLPWKTLNRFFKTSFHFFIGCWAISTVNSTSILTILRHIQFRKKYFSPWARRRVENECSSKNTRQSRPCYITQSSGIHHNRAYKKWINPALVLLQIIPLEEKEEDFYEYLRVSITSLDDSLDLPLSQIR